ncbi:MAG: hypothetical protein ACYCT5_05590 [Leptospirillum sp.]
MSSGHLAHQDPAHGIHVGERETIRKTEFSSWHNLKKHKDSRIMLYRR